ncbi:hypothetical protein [Actinomadura hibisca]|uniref:hypothetical protein n=1 Tax=Actinomadura hibisca TaxID=68565 RepID=UPI00082DA4CE|nr:hypothetical protein [Actinomadura hibisca]
MTLPERTTAAPSTAPSPTAEPGTESAIPAGTIISHAEMNDALDAGLVRRFGQTIGYAVHFRNCWWIHFERGWISADQRLADMLEARSAEMTGQDAIVARSAVHRPTPADRTETTPQ